MLYHRATPYGGMKGGEFLLSTACMRNPVMTSSSVYIDNICLFVCLFACNNFAVLPQLGRC